MQAFDAIVIGAGPSGSRIAELLSKSGMSVLILEKKRSVGKSACSGLVSARLAEIVPLGNDCILNLIRGARFHSGKNSILLEKQRIAAFVIDRVRFDTGLLLRAQRAGAIVHLSEPFSDYSIGKDYVVVNKKYRAKVVVGADGAASAVRAASGLAGSLAFMNGAITYFDEANSEPYVDVYYANRFSEDFFAWRIPRGNSVEYGVASKKDHLGCMRRFLASQKKTLGRFFSHPMVCGVQETAGERLILVGDAAGQVKPLSGGGIIYGLLCAKIAADAVIRAKEANDFSADFFKKAYDRKWKALLLEKMRTGAMLLSAIKALSERERSLLFEMIAEKKADVEAFADMDFL